MAKSDIQQAELLFRKYQPPNTHLEIKETDGKLCARYLVSLAYTSSKSDKKISITAKGHNLPTKDDGLLLYYVRQIVLSPREISREFSRIYFLERRARQQAFLQGEIKNIRVMDNTSLKDRLAYKDYN